MRILFAGSPGIAVPALEALVGLGFSDPKFQLVGVLSNPDKPRGRHGTPEPTEVAAAAALLSEQILQGGGPPLRILKPERLGAAVREAVAALEPDLLVSFAYGRIFGPRFLSLFPRGGINIHPSLLPKYRGAAPIPAAILNRDRETGVTVQRLAPEMDTGDILLQESFFLTGRETTASLSDLAARKGADLLTEVLRSLARGGMTGRPQNHRAATYCSLITKEDGRIDWSRSAAEIDACIRAFTPWPLCFTRHGEQDLFILEGKAGEKYPGNYGPGKRGFCSSLENAGFFEPGKVLGIDKTRGILIQTGDGILEVTRLQYRTKKALDWQSFLNGALGFTGSQLR
ncbi:MAG: methionyl-tRNA formyltransferase [Treponema sp.]|jgi:methionyl-tRNA formyltransferase|nr:methionyl-tRNA formyltransferase [Treponema sp.]